MLNEKKYRILPLMFTVFLLMMATPTPVISFQDSGKHVQDRRWKNISESKRQALTSLLPIEVK